MSDNSIQAPSPEYLGELLPQYGIEAFIAQGGMGAVYKARQISLDRDVAIKVLLYEFGEDVEFRESFTTEAKAMARLNHPNLLGVFDYGTVDGMPYIVMEYVDGGSLHEAAWNKAIDPSQAVAIVKGICEGLAHAHGHNIVHRDIKPSNILLTPAAEPKVADFGLAHAMDSENAGLVMGTPGYTAPEVFQNPDQAGKLADVYSVGVILHQLLTGIDPAGCLEPPSQVTGHPRLDLIWRKATHITPALRYPSVAAMATDLESWLVSIRKTPVVTGRAAPNRSFVAPRRPVQKRRSGGGDILVKLIIFGILTAVAYFTYQYLQEQKVGSAGNSGSIKVPTPDPKPIPGIPLEPDLVEIPSTPDPGEVSTNETLLMPPVVDTGSEPDSKVDLSLPPGDMELRQRASGLISDARKKRDKALADNAAALLFQLSGRVRSTKKDEAASIERLKGDVVDNRVPLTDEVLGLPDNIARDIDHARAKEEGIDEAYLSELTRIRDAYVGRIDKAAAETTEVELKPRLLAQAERAKDLDSWIGLLSPEPERVIKKSTVAFGGFLGHWDMESYNHVTRWIAHSDGTIEIVGEKREATWVILGNGTLEIRWRDKDPYTFTRDGNGWTGTTAHGGKAELTRGNW